MNLLYQKGIFAANYLNENLIFNLVWKTVYYSTCSLAWTTQVNHQKQNRKQFQNPSLLFRCLVYSVVEKDSWEFWVILTAFIFFYPFRYVLKAD